MLKRHPTRKVGAKRFPLMLSGAGPCSASGPTAAALLALKALLWSASLRPAAGESGHPRGLHVAARLTLQVLVLTTTLVTQRGGDPLMGALSILLLFRIASLRLPKWPTPNLSSASPEGQPRR